jgi:hypothetical protein
MNWIPRTLLCLCFFASTLAVYFYEFTSQFEDPVSGLQVQPVQTVF